jgi:hypothetical protein
MQITAPPKPLSNYAPAVAGFKFGLQIVQPIQSRRPTSADFLRFMVVIRQQLAQLAQTRRHRIEHAGPGYKLGFLGDKSDLHPGRTPQLTIIQRG